MLVAAGVYAALIAVAILALTHDRVPPAPTPAGALNIDPSLNSATGDFVTVTGWSDCKMHVKLAATSKADFSGASGTIVLTGIGPDSCQGKTTGQIMCLVVRGNQALLSWWLNDTSGIFTIGNAQATVTKNDRQTNGPPVDRAAFGLAGGSPECPPGISGKGPQIMSATIQISPAR